jgi:hypothetical protein
MNKIGPQAPRPRQKKVHTARGVFNAASSSASLNQTEALAVPTLIVYSVIPSEVSDPRAVCAVISVGGATTAPSFAVWSDLATAAVTAF